MMPDIHEMFMLPSQDFDAPPELPSSRAPYTVLGHDRGRFYFGGVGGQVRDFSARDLGTTMSLCELASLTYWEREFPSKKGADTTAIGAALMQAAFAMGIYDPSRLRGRGAWIDDGRTVLHLGDRLYVDGTETLVQDLKTRAIYEHALPLPLPAVDPIGAVQAKKLLDLCMMPSWEKPAYMGRLLAGWCVVAPVCGAMPWRPHLWITGEKASGKSTVLDGILSPIIGAIGLHVQSVTTEAGIRQELGSDARPVIFDEAETQTEADRLRIQSVLNLARQASTEGGAAIVKGAANGRATHYRIRSMFAFSSINYGVTQAADESRVVALTLHPDVGEGAQDRFDAFRIARNALITPDFCAGLFARTMTLIPVIRHNASMFADAIASAGHGRRMGDTIGVLLAGAWSLRSGKLVSPTEADAFLAETDWLRAAVASNASMPEWAQCIGHLMQHRTRVHRSNAAGEDIPVGELLSIVAGEFGDVGITDATQALARMGIRLQEAGRGGVGLRSVLVANTSVEVAQAFSKSIWGASWRKTISRTPGAEATVKPFRFGSLLARAIALPVSVVLGGGGAD